MRPTRTLFSASSLALQAATIMLVTGMVGYKAWRLETRAFAPIATAPSATTTHEPGFTPVAAPMVAEPDAAARMPGGRLDR
ncbi:MAG: hypothetical protein AAFR20_00635 [Pseudomonadota bacterium]